MSQESSLKASAAAADPDSPTAPFLLRLAGDGRHCTLRRTGAATGRNSILDMPAATFTPVCA